MLAAADELAFDEQRGRVVGGSGGQGGDFSSGRSPTVTPLVGPVMMVHRHAGGGRRGTGTRPLG